MKHFKGANNSSMITYSRWLPMLIWNHNVFNNESDIPYWMFQTTYWISSRYQSLRRTIRAGRRTGELADADTTSTTTISATPSTPTTITTAVPTTAVPTTIPTTTRAGQTPTTTTTTRDGHATAATTTGRSGHVTTTPTTTRIGQTTTTSSTATTTTTTTATPIPDNTRTSQQASNDRTSTNSRRSSAGNDRRERAITDAPGCLFIRRRDFYQFVNNHTVS